jgi:hypothetical protein
VLLGINGTKKIVVGVGEDIKLLPGEPTEGSDEMHARTEAVNEV